MAPSGVVALVSVVFMSVSMLRAGMAGKAGDGVKVRAVGVRGESILSVVGVGCG